MDLETLDSVGPFEAEVELAFGAGAAGPPPSSQVDSCPHALLRSPAAPIRPAIMPPAALA